ncbi:hypothetical protein SAMN05421787_101592 [Virgibacillus pantothenticus]|nr:hypothetical protein SAMN05421787_101592 [Virgibacillus pantothenticus]
MAGNGGSKVSRSENLQLLNLTTVLKVFYQATITEMHSPPAMLLLKWYL